MDELWVRYFFARFHHLLGFEKVTAWQTDLPDVVALRNGAETKIELESRLEYAYNHYKHSANNKSKYKDGEWVHRNNEWIFVLSNFSEPILCRVDDEGDNLYINEYHLLFRKSLKPVVDVIVCWDAHTDSRSKRLLEDIDEVIVLSEVLPKIGLEERIIPIPKKSKHNYPKHRQKPCPHIVEFHIRNKPKGGETEVKKYKRLTKEYQP